MAAFSAASSTTRLTATCTWLPVGEDALDTTPLSRVGKGGEQPKADGRKEILHSLLMFPAVVARLVRDGVGSVSPEEPLEAKFLEWRK